jgi:glycine cleavage system H protein
VIPDDLRYTSEHEWIATQGDGSGVRVGITHYAQHQLGDIVFVSLPEVGATVEAGQAFGEVESPKSVSELYAPVSGTVVARNETLVESPGLINSAPYGAGWLIELEPANTADLGNLLDAQAYAALTGHA